MAFVETLAAPTRILIVDDDASVRDVISVLLQEEGYECRTAAGAEEALDIAAQEAPPLVISDMKMPGRDGIWLLEAFRERFPETAVVMLTGYGDTEAAVDCLRRGAVDYLLKPPKLTDLIRAIERALAKRRIELARKRYQKKLERKSETAPPSCAVPSRTLPKPTRTPSWLWWPRSMPGNTRPPTTASAW